MLTETQMSTKRPEKERQMFSMLALRQLERAAEVTESVRKPLFFIPRYLPN